MSKKELATTGGATPAFIDKSKPARGSENVSSDDIVLPRLSLIQALSPQIDEDDPAYIEGVAQGDIINDLTGQNFGREVTIIPVFFRKSYVIWKDRKKGGGFCGMYETNEAANMALQGLEPPYEDYEVVDTVDQFVLVVKEDGAVEEAILSMAKTKMSCSRRLQSLIRLAEVDSFALQFKLKSVGAKSDLGKYFNYDVVPDGFVSEEHYHAGEAVYNTISQNAMRYKAADDGAPEM